MEGTLSTKEVELRAGEIIALRVKPEDGFDAQVLGVILDIPKMAGEDYTDGECLDLILKSLRPLVQPHGWFCLGDCMNTGKLEAYQHAGKIYHIDCALESDTLAALAHPVFTSNERLRGHSCPTCGEVVTWLRPSSLFLV